jgi:hypothetical protein
MAAVRLPTCLTLCSRSQISSQSAGRACPGNIWRHSIFEHDTWRPYGKLPRVASEGEPLCGILIAWSYLRCARNIFNLRLMIQWPRGYYRSRYDEHLLQPFSFSRSPLFSHNQQPRVRMTGCVRATTEHGQHSTHRIQRQHLAP